jgi:hypothetical protein
LIKMLIWYNKLITNLVTCCPILCTRNEKIGYHTTVYMSLSMR